MAEQKTLERKAQIAAEETEEREKDARLETLRKSARRKLGIGILSGKLQTTFLPTVSSLNKKRTMEETEAPALENNSAEFLRQNGRPFYKLYTFSDEEILADPRLVVENVLRERGLLQVVLVF